MWKLASIVILLGACKSREDYRDQNQKAPEPEAVTVVEKKPPPPPPKKALTPEELGKCQLTASGAFKAEQTTFGGKAATNVSYWLSEAERGAMSGVDGFAVHCHGPEFKFSILPGGGKKDGMPFGPKKYEFKKGAGDASLMIMLGPKLTFGDPNGTVNITALDKKHIAGTVDLTGTTMPGKGAVKLTGSFDFQCPGFAACE